MSDRFLLARALGATAALAVSVLSAAAQTGEGASRLSGLNLSGDQPIQIESDRLEVRENENVAVFSGNVSVVQGETLMRTGRMTVYYAQDGGTAAAGGASIERLEVDGKVYIRSEDQVATGDRGTFDMGTEVLTLSGSEVVLTQGENVIVGCLLTIQMRSGEARLDGCRETGAGTGRVKMLLQPGSQNQ